MIQRYILTNLTSGGPTVINAPGVQCWIEECPDETDYADRNSITFGQDEGFGLPLIERSMYKRCTPWTTITLWYRGGTTSADPVVLLVSDDPGEDIVMAPGLQII